MKKLLPASLALALALPFGARADTSTDLNALRQEIDAMRADYETRLKALEQRLQAAEAANRAAPATTTATAEESAAPALPPMTPVPAAPPQPTPVAAAAGGGANAFNPAMALILSGLYTSTSQSPATYRISGFPLPPNAEIGPGTQGFSLSETELDFGASIDPWLRGSASLAVRPDDTIGVEEAYIQTTSLGQGFALKAGRFFSGIGYLNPLHSHVWDFVDAPLAYQAMLGTQYGDDGVQLTWLAPLDHYVEFGAELGRGFTFPGSDTPRNGAGMAALYVHTGGDLGDSHSWRAGVSLLGAKATDQSLLATNAAGTEVSNAFTGNTRVWIVDAVWKWAPDGNATRTNFKLQGEYLNSTRSGSLVYDVGNTDSLGSYRVMQSGWYLQAVYQFMPRWRAGLRTERLSAGTPDYGLNSGSLADTGYGPSKNTLMVDFNPSEFSRIRLQVAQDRARQGVTDNQFFLQYQMSLGAHGAHGY